MITDPLLDRFMPRYDIVERHHSDVAAPAHVTFATACHSSLEDSAMVRAIFKARELIMGSTPDARPHPHGLLDHVKSLGWVMLAEQPGEAIVMGAVTKPWQANVVFRSVPAEQFAAFDEPDYVKIAWTLRVEATGPGTSVFRTETRAVATDAEARTKFRFYWMLLSPGIILIRELMTRAVKAHAEQAAAR